MEDTGSYVKDNRGTAVSEGCVNTPVTIRRISLRSGSASQDEYGKLIYHLVAHTYKYVISPVYLLESVLPNITSPFVADVEFVGSKYNATRF